MWKVIYAVTAAAVVLAAVDALGKGSDEGFIYGKVTTRSGDTYIGAIRWGTQEFFWDDLFNATKTENPWASQKKQISNGTDKKARVKVFGFDINPQSFSLHQFVTRFGDIASIEARRDEDANLMMKDGTVYEATGYGDIGVTLLIYDQSLGKVKIDWEKVDKVEFMKTPDKVDKPGYRLYGKVKTRTQEFSGGVMWDAEECVSSDVLDGETKDGDLEIEFGKIRSIAKNSSGSSKVKLKDGREFILSGTNDVDEDNRGIYVEDKRYGKVELDWDQFEEVVYDDEGGSGDPYDIYRPTGRLKGTVSVYKVGEISGEIVYDLDENEGFEILDGKIDDINFYIPFRQIVSITPKGRHSSLVKLINGEELLLEDEQDVSSGNTGILISKDGKQWEYYEWSQIDKIEFKQ